MTYDLRLNFPEIFCLDSQDARGFQSESVTLTSTENEGQECVYLISCYK